MWFSLLILLYTLVFQTFGQLPMLMDDDVELVQSNAILRALARKYGNACFIWISVNDNFLMSWFSLKQALTRTNSL